MCAHTVPQRRSAGSRIEAVFTWLGGGHWRELGERHERSTHAIGGVVVLLGAALAWLVATLAVGESARWPILSILPVTVVLGLLVGAVTRATASGPTGGWAGIAGRAAVAAGVGVIVGELAALVLFSGAIDRRLDEQAARQADSAPAVVQAAAGLDRTRDARVALDNAVEQARLRRDQALVIARCEYNPTPACPQTRITGVPGVGPETRTANELLADAQQELANAATTRDRRAPELDAKIDDDERALAQARQTAIADADRGLGSRWVALHSHAVADPGTLLLRLVTDVFFAVLFLLPLTLRLWHGEMSHDRRAAARAERDRAEVEADTAIAVKRAEVRAAAETMWADQQLATARFAVEAQTEIDHAQHRRRVIEALDGPVEAASQRTAEPVEDDKYLPAPVEAGSPVEPRGERAAPLIPTIPDVTKAAARWIRPLVPPFVARAIDTTTQPLRAARQVFEEVEEITFSLKRTRKVIVDSEESAGPAQPLAATDTHTDNRDYGQAAADAEYRPLGPVPGDFPSIGSHRSERQRKLAERDGPREVRAADGPRQLPPAE